MLLLGVIHLLPAYLRGNTAQQIAAARADKAIPSIQADDQDTIGEALQQIPLKFLLLAQRFFHLAPLGDVHQRALVTDDCAGSIPDGTRRIQKDAGRPILAPQRKLAAALAPPIIRAPPQHRALPRIQIKCAGVEGQKLVPAAAAQHSNQRRVAVKQLALWRAEVDAFVESLEKFGEAALFLALFGHVPGEGADAHDFVTLDDCIQHAVEIKGARVVLDLDANQARPAALFEKAGKTRFDVASQRFGQKLVDLVAYDVGVGDSQQLGDTAIHCPQSTVERAGKSHVVKRVDEFLEAALGALNDLTQLVELLVGRRDAGTVAQIAQQVLQFRNFATPPVYVRGKQDRQHQQPNRNRTQVIGKVLQPFPGKRGQTSSQQDEKREGEPPQPGFFFFQISWSAPRAFGLIFFVHNCRY